MYDPGTGRYFFWCTRTDKVDWFPPGHPKSNLLEPASRVREGIMVRFCDTIQFLYNLQFSLPGLKVNFLSLQLMASTQADEQEMDIESDDVISLQNHFGLLLVDKADP